MNKRKIILGVIALALLAVVGTTAVMAQRADEPPPDSEVVDLSQIKEDVVRELFDGTGRMISPNRRLAKVARDHEGGFGGYYFHRTDKSIVFVYMQDIAKTASAEAAFRAAYRGDRQVTQIIPVQGAYSLDKLVEWYYILSKALIESGIHLSTTSVRQFANRIAFGLADAAQIDDALQIMEKLGIPKGAVVLEQGGYIELLADKDNVRAKWRPLVGGIQHEEAWLGKGRCTIGFVTERDDVEGLVIASHCTNDDGDVGGLDDADVHQPTDPLFGDNIIAEETIDPEMENIDNDDCPSGWDCRYSDAAFAELNGDESLDLGKIAKPEDIGETDVDPVGTTFDITGESAFINTGDDIYYIGRTEGWQTAEIIEECISPTRSAANQEKLICLGKARMTGSSSDPSQGDSGAPVVKVDTGNDVDLLGILVGSDPNNTDEFYFAKIGYIYMELGQSSTWDSCVSLC